MGSLKNFLRSAIAKTFSLLISLFPLKKNSVLVIESSFPSGSNTKILIPQLMKKYKVKVILEKDIFLPLSSPTSYWKRIRTLIHISKYPLVITSHGFNKLNRKQVLINTWHGIPLKAMAQMEMESSQKVKEFNMDYLIMTSKMQSVLMSACIHVEYGRNRILGNPRNDYLFHPQKDNLRLLTGETSFTKVLLYMPTFRQGFAGRNEGVIADDIFNFDDAVQEKDFLDYIESNNYLLIIKLHPQEEALLEEKFKILNSRNILVLKNIMLLENNLDIYEILPQVDLLITDYSSIYFDYLLTDKPMVFVNNDLETYKQIRGLLLEPYEFWTPGYKATNYKELEQVIRKSFETDEFKEKRKELKDVFHLHQDGRSSDRVIELIDKKFAQ